MVTMTPHEAYLDAIVYAATKHQNEREKMIAAAQVAHTNGVSIEDIAGAAGVHRSTVYRWLNPDRGATVPHGGGADR